MAENTTLPRLEAKVLLSGSLTARTGLHIGRGAPGNLIGAERGMVREGRDGAPYVPGSSLKGSLRSLLERAGCAKGFEVRKEGDEWRAPPCRCGAKDCAVCVLFGLPAEVRARAKEGPLPPGRLTVRDGRLLNAQEISSWRYLDIPYAEVKTEVALDRLSASGTPRSLERVPAGARFALELVIAIHEGDDASWLLRSILDGLDLLAQDALGGHGSRGYGAVSTQLDLVRRFDVAALREGGGGESAWSEGPEAAGLEGLSLPWISPRP
jgi:CRISPR-associated protein Csm3